MPSPSTSKLLVVRLVAGPTGPANATQPLNIQLPANQQRTASVAPEYRELFAALMKIRNPSLVARVMAAINNSSNQTVHCDCCTAAGLDKPAPAAEPKPAPQLCTKAVQTYESYQNSEQYRRIPLRKRRRPEPRAIPITCDDKESGWLGAQLKPRSTEAESIACSSIQSTEDTATENHTQTAACLLEMNTIKSEPAIPTAFLDQQPQATEVPDFNVDDFDFDDILKIFDLEMPLDDNIEQDVPRDVSNRRVNRMQRKMKQEFNTMFVPDPNTGLRSIHVAIINGEHKRVMRQIAILKIMKVDLNHETLSAIESDGPDAARNTLLHFAVESKSDSALPIVQHLLDHGADPLLCNAHDENVLHYAIANTPNAAIFNALLVHIERFHNPDVVRQTLADRNPDGLSAIHLIVQHDKYEFLHALVACIQRLTGSSMPPVDCSSIAELAAYIDQFDEESFPRPPAVCAVRARLLDQPDERSGRTALLQAVLNRSTHSALLLLAHLSDPRLCDFSGNDCASACLVDDRSSPEETIIGKCVQKMLYNLRVFYDAPKRSSVRIRGEWTADLKKRKTH